MYLKEILFVIGQGTIYDSRIHLIIIESSISSIPARGLFAKIGGIESLREALTT